MRNRVLRVEGVRTLKDAAALHLMQLSRWLRPGPTNVAWLRAEEARIKADPTRTAMIVSNGKSLALFVNRVAGRHPRL